MIIEAVLLAAATGAVGLFALDNDAIAEGVYSLIIAVLLFGVVLW